ncbi:MAG: hypothetical protein KatS3mg081_1114 [Gemmatimonadales bacterium]|nr:MAG: hypothetical protein KatS3mg081_1114 [Gemmatimonadales bacterium]
MSRRPKGLGLLSAAAVFWACGSLLGDPDRIIALEVPGGTNRSLNVGDTLVLAARAITARGERLNSVSVEWAVVDTAVTAFSLDPASGTVVGLQPGSGRVQGSYQELKTDPITITVLASR